MNIAVFGGGLQHYAFAPNVEEQHSVALSNLEIGLHLCLLLLKAR